MYRSDIEFTGERVVPGKTPEEVYREHIDRYVFAATLVAGKVVLDVACGTGYGVGHVAEHGAAAAVGVDLSMETVGYARERFGQDRRTSFICADGIRLPFADGCFDAVVSFETIEHIRLYEEFLIECARVLKRDGVLICSTPNKRVFSPDATIPPNPFHVYEFLPDEFLRVLRGSFGEVVLYGQCDVTLSDNTVERDRGVHGFVDDDAVTSGYMVAVARKHPGGYS